MGREINILGIETSCDETAVAVGCVRMTFYEKRHRRTGYNRMAPNSG